MATAMITHKGSAHATRLSPARHQPQLTPGLCRHPGLYPLVPGPLARPDRGYTLVAVDTISFGPGREPRRVWRGWRPRRGWPGRWAWLVVLVTATALAVAAVVLVSAGRPERRTVSAPSAQPLLLAGIPARGAGTDLFLGGENAWRPGRPPRPVAGLLSNGLSSLLPPGHGAEVDQLAPVPGGVVAHISDISTAVTYGALGRVVFIPAANAPARVIARATMIAVSPGGHRYGCRPPSSPCRTASGYRPVSRARPGPST